MRNPFAKTLSGSLMCPHCESHDLAFVEDRGPSEKRYRCRKCGGYLRYQYRNKPVESDRDPKSAYKGHDRGLNLQKAMQFFRKVRTQ